MAKDEENTQGDDLENVDGEGTSDEDTGTEEGESEDGKTDPFDDIDDIDEMRKKAKEERAKRQRLSKKAAETTTKKVVKSTQIDESKFVTKDDYYKSNEKKAARQLTVVGDSDSEKEAEFKSDLKANWKEVMRYYRDISGRETVEDIVDDITDAYNAFRRRNPKKEPDEGKEAASILVKKTGKGGQTPTGDKQRKKSILRRQNLKGTEQMSSWYPGTEQKD